MAGALERIEETLASGTSVTRDQIVELVEECPEPTERLLELSDGLRRRAFGDEVRRCADGFTSNVCTAGCNYCYLAAKHQKRLPSEFGVPRRLSSVEEFVEDAKAKEARGATQYKIVGTEVELADSEFELAVAAFRAIKEATNLGLCASMGAVSFERLCLLRRAGAEYFNHSLEGSRRVYERMGCKLSYDDRIRQNVLAKRAGLKRCTGLMVGLGEEMSDRIEVAFTLRDVLGVESLPFNIFVPMRDGEKPKITPIEALFTLALFRIIMPEAHIVANNGNAYFGDLFVQVLKAGASGIGLKDGNYLSHARADFPADGLVGSLHG